MKQRAILLFAAALALLTACPKGTIPHELVTTTAYCYTLSNGVGVGITNGPCPLFESADGPAYRTKRRYNKDCDWSSYTLTFVQDYTIDCGRRAAMGCTDFAAKTITVSLWPTWSWTDTLEHEFDHVGIHCEGGVNEERRRACLDKEPTCDEESFWGRRGLR